MAEIRITIPDDKAQLVLDAVTFYIENESDPEAEPVIVTKEMALSWIKGKLISEIKRLVKNYQEQTHRENFSFDDPMS